MVKTGEITECTPDDQQFGNSEGTEGHCCGGICKNSSGDSKGHATQRASQAVKESINSCEE